MILSMKKSIGKCFRGLFMLVNAHSSNSYRNDGIDSLRGFSILSVILLHCYVHMPFSNDLLPSRLINIIFRSGYYGVIIFFVISGFLITTTSIKRWGNLQNIPFGHFYQMRFARIMPSLLVLLMLLCILDIVGIPGFIIHTKTSLTQAVFSALTFQLNCLEAKTGYLPASWDALWSLSVEEMFYLFFPLACLVFRKTKYFVLAMLGFIIIGPFARTTFFDNEIWSDHSYLSCMDGIAIGCLAALFSQSFTLTRKIFLFVLILGISLFTFIFIFRKQAYDIGISKIGLNVTILEIGVALILITMQEYYTKGKRFGSLWTQPLRWFGRNSYENYLIHSFFVIVFAGTLFDKNQTGLVIAAWYAIVLILSGVTGQLISSFFSEPMNRLLRNKGNVVETALGL
jgi:peptidoglycan/LPS O-acetylase OafA/YrhL